MRWLVALGFLSFVGGAWAQSPPASPFALKFDGSGKIPYSADLIQAMIADAMKHGDARRGAIVFGAHTSACMACHVVGKHGGEVGPNLTLAGTCNPPEAVVEGVFWPNRTVKDGFNAIAIEDSKGRIIQGIVRDDTATEIVLKDAAGKMHRIAKKEIEEQRSIGSLMPEGLTAPMTVEQRRDLIRYLLELGKTEGLHHLSHEPVKFEYSREPLRPEDWPNAKHRVNRDRVYDFYTREAMHFRGKKPLPLLLPEWPGLDGGKYGHWGNQNDNVWKDDRWNQSDLGSVQAGVFRSGNLTVARAVCVRLGENGEMAACFNPDTLQFEALWKGGFVRFSDRRFGFIEGLRPDGELLPTPEKPKLSQPFVYRGFYRHSKRTVFAYRLGDVEMLDAPWVENGKFIREVAPADKHSLAYLTKGGKAQWPQVLATRGSLGAGRPYAVDSIELPTKNPWNALMHIGGHDFFPDGSAALCTMEGDVWRVEGLDATLENVRWRRIASGLHHALGLVIAEKSICVLGRDQITRLVDFNGDGETDFYECFSNAFATSPAGHDYICGLERDAAGAFYTASGNQGLVRISPDGRKAEVLANGFRNPDGLGLTPDGLLTVPCSEGEWTPSSMICETQAKGKRRPHFGYGGPQGGKPPELPLVYLPRGLDNSSGGQVYVSSAKWGPLQGQRVHLSFGAASHFLLLRDEVDGQAQGAVVPLAGDFRSGVHRGRFSPADGQLYVSGMAGWGTYAAEDGCFQRVRCTGDAVQLPKRFHVHRNGVLVEFTAPLDRSFVEKAGNHFAQSWNYRYSAGYGSREFSPSHYGMPGHDPVPIASVHLLADGKTLFFEMPDLQPVNQLHLQVGIAKDQTRDLFVTVHKLGEPFRELPNYQERTHPIAAHPILKDLASAAKREPNPWQKPIADARAVQVEAGKNLTFATPILHAKAGEALRLTFKNPDVVPHNWVLIKPGTLKTVGELGNLLIGDPDAVARSYVPKSEDVLVYADVVDPQAAATVHFQAPRQPGRYPFLCTFPGHWMVMNGELIVE
ncbi:MAG: c-type cytochrome [Gemmataceae bacterium]|nr:c-type cytochrome [Gemmataceae bacterium]